ncbi:hypothetical protein D3C81_995010 [compost metagenome]
MHRQTVLTVLQVVFHLNRFIGKLPAFANRHKPHAQRVSQRRANHETTSLGTGDQIDLKMGHQLLQFIDRLAIHGAVIQQRGNVLETDARLRKIRNHPNVLFKIQTNLLLVQMRAKSFHFLEKSFMKLPEYGLASIQ